MNRNKILITILMACFSSYTLAGQTYPVVDTGQIRCYNNRTEIEYPKAGKHFFGQDAHYNGLQSTYRNNEDGTITDRNTGLMWTQDPGRKKTYEQAVAGASTWVTSRSAGGV